MCKDCGCPENGAITINGTLLKTPNDGSLHVHENEVAAFGRTKEITIKKNILSKNNSLAASNRRHFQSHAVFCTNWISAPGSGKTMLLERFIGDHPNPSSITVIEGDQQTDNDAKRIRTAGAKAMQINTGAACHLNAEMIQQALKQLELENNTLLFIENVGNMVCPTAFDLGEAFKVAIISCTEGDDKPIKYPDIILSAKVLLINKVDLLPHVIFDLDRCIQFAQNINPAIQIFPVSATSGAGLPLFYQWLQEQQITYCE